jgi:hypothetical protein
MARFTNHVRAQPTLAQRIGEEWIQIVVRFTGPALLALAVLALRARIQR